MVATSTPQDLVLTVTLILTAGVWSLSHFLHENSKAVVVQQSHAHLSIPEWALGGFVEPETEEEQPPVLNSTDVAIVSMEVPFEKRFRDALSGKMQPSSLNSTGDMPAVTTSQDIEHEESHDLEMYRRLEAAQVRASFSTDHTHRFSVGKDLAAVQRDFGLTDAALRLYNKVRKDVSTATEAVSLMSEIGETQLRRGELAESLENLHGASDLLSEMRSSNAVGTPELVSKLSSEVHERLGKAHHVGANAWDFGETHERQALGHYMEALGYTDGSNRIESLKGHIDRLRNGDAPLAAALKRLRGARPVSEEDGYDARISAEEDKARLSALPLAERVRALIDELLPDRAESEVLAALADVTSAHADAVAQLLNLLAQVRKAQGCYDAASDLYALALGLALRAPAGETRDAASDAYLGLSHCQAALHGTGRPSDAVAIYEGAVRAANAAGIPKQDPLREDFERRLKANAYAAVSSPMSITCIALAGEQMPAEVLALFGSAVTV